MKIIVLESPSAEVMIKLTNAPNPTLNELGMLRVEKIGVTTKNEVIRQKINKKYGRN